MKLRITFWGNELISKARELLNSSNRAWVISSTIAKLDRFGIFLCSIILYLYFSCTIICVCNPYLTYVLWHR